MPLVEKANRYYQGEGETKESWHPIEGTNPINEMGIYSNQSAVINAAYNSYTLEESNENTNIISVNEIEEITLRDLGEIECISLGNGVIADITCQLQIIDYLIEEEDAVLSEAKDRYRKVNPDGSIGGAVGRTAKAIHDFMTRYAEKEAAQKQIADKQEDQLKQIALKAKYEEAIQQGIVIRQGLYKRLQDYVEELYYDIQGEGIKPSADNAIKYIQPLYTIFKYLKREKYASDKYFWNNTTGFNLDSNSNYYYFYDNKNDIIKYEISNNERALIKRFEFGRSIGQLNVEDFPILLDEMDSNGNYTNTVSGLKNQILKIASDNVNYDIDADTNVNGDLFEIIELFNAMLDQAKEEFDRQNVINNNIINNDDLYRYVLATPSFFIRSGDTTPTYDINAYTYYNKDENNNFISKIYFTSDELKSDVENRKVYLYYITYESYSQFLIDNILNKLYDISQPEDSTNLDADRIYDLLHYFNTLKLFVQTDKPLSLDEYKEIFFIGETIEDYDWMYVDNPYDKLGINGTLEDTPFDEIYAVDGDENNPPRYFQGIIVDTYDNMVQAYSEDIKAFKIKQDFDKQMIEYNQPYILVDKLPIISDGSDEIEYEDLLIFNKIPSDSNYSPNLTYYICNPKDDDHPENNRYTRWVLNGNETISDDWNNNKDNLYLLNPNLVINENGAEDEPHGYYYKVENEDGESNYIRIYKDENNNYVNELGNLIEFDREYPLYRSTLYNKAQRWNGLRNAIENAEAQIEYWQAIIKAKGIIDGTIEDANIIYDPNDQESIDNLLAYAQERIDYYNLRIAYYNDELDQAYEDYQQFLELETAANKATNNYNILHTIFDNLFTEYTNEVTTYVSLIQYDTDTETTTTFLEWLAKYDDLVKNENAYSPTSPVANIINQDIPELNNYYNLYKQYLMDMQYSNNNSKAAILINNFNAIVDTWEAQKEFNKKYDNNDIKNLGAIQRADQKLAELANEIADLLEIVNSIDVSDNFNEETYITEIKAALAHYLYTLGIVYLDKVERRYG